MVGLVNATPRAQAWHSPVFCTSSALTSFLKSRSITPAETPLVSGRRRRTVMASAATEQIERVVAENLNMGRVTSMSRAGSSGWAVMHRATTEDGHRLFIKVSRQHVFMFEGEAKGLSRMCNTRTIKVPEVYHFGALEGKTMGSFIVMEALDLIPVYDKKELGVKLAEMHLAEPAAAEARAGKFGFSVDNTIGGTEQPNAWMDNWIDFFREKRLKHQLLLTGDAELMDKGAKVCLRMHELFRGLDDVKPSLLHGDLWSGNIAGVQGSPVIFDPACYYGHHEADFGMSWCGGFSPAFWEGYRELIPRSPGFDKRQKLYQLYHYLNHLNLFGGGYYGMSDMLLNQLLSELW